MLVELLGPSGVGKSTVLDKAMQMRSDNPEWKGPSESDVRGGQLAERPDPNVVRTAFDEMRFRPLVEHSIAVLSGSAMAPSQKLQALSFLQRSCYETSVVEARSKGTTIVHDELILHRAFSLLLFGQDLRTDATKYFELAPLPDAAVVFIADPQVILTRVKSRSTVVNCYVGLDTEGLRLAITNGLEIALVAAEVLTRRDINVKTIDSTESSEDAAQELHEHARVIRDGGPQ